jgi:hypothetical protein
MSIDEELLLYVGRRVYEMVRSGEHTNFASIKAAIVEEGRAEGVEWLEVPGVEAALQQICSVTL